MGQSFFHFKSFSILQQSEGLKVTTDACVLGALAHHQHPLHILDIGTGTGVLSLMMAQKFPEAAIDAFEIEPAAAVQARDNFERSVFSQRICLMEEDYLLSHSGPYDLVICNPPYFTNHLKGASKVKNSAIHNHSLPFDRLSAKISQSLKKEGVLWMILPPAEMQAFILEAQSSGLFVSEFIRINNYPGKHFRTVACFTLTKDGAPHETELLISDTNGARTPEFSQLMHDFYLENTTIYKRSSSDSI